MKLGDLLGNGNGKRDRFQIEQKIGAGGMGEVYRARDRVSGEPVAIKVLSDAREHRTGRFAREVELLSQLSHPGIVRYITHGEMPSGELFLVMEWLDGEDLGARLLRGPLTTSEAVKLASRVAEALGVAHARGIVHRDLKPSNLFLPGGQIERVKVLDFGIAQREGRSALTRTGWLGGAVADVRVDAPDSAIEGLDGGMPQLPAALAARLAEREAVRARPHSDPADLHARLSSGPPRRRGSRASSRVERSVRSLADPTH